MRFFTALLAGAVMVSTAVALTFNSVPSSAIVGVPEVITYGGNGGNPVTINLLKGPSNNLQLVAVLTSTTTSGSYTWTPDSSLVDGNDYALSIVQGDVTNYSAQFPVTGASASVLPSPSPSVSATVTPTATATASVSATATASVSATVSSIASSTIASANGSVTATSTPLSNTTTSSYASGRTGTSMPRNTTMSMATLTASSTAAGSITGDPRGGGYATETGGSPGAATSIVMSTGGANVLASSLALIIGTFAAVMYLN